MNNLHGLNAEFIKPFYNNHEVFCVCFISGKDNEADYTDEDYRYLERVFSCITPILIKFVKNKEREQNPAQSFNSLQHFAGSQFYRRFKALDRRYFR